MTTSIQFLGTLAPYLVVGDLAALSAGDRSLIVQSINQTLDWWDSNAPPALRNRPWTTTLRAPRTVSVTVTRDSQAIEFASDPGESAIGCTIVIEGDTSQNRLHSLTELKLSFLGTTGTRTATLYGDGAPLPSGFIGFTEPLRYERTDTTRRVITPFNNQVAWTGPIIVNEPWYYTLEQGQTLDGTAPFTIARFLYATSYDTRVSSQIEAHAARWTLSDFRTARRLDLQDTHWSLMHPLVIARLMAKPNIIATGKVEPKLILQDAADARDLIRKLATPGAGIPNMVGTPNEF